MAAEYQLPADAISGRAYSGIIRVADGRWITNAAGSADWDAYVTWTQANQPDAFKSPVEGGAVITLQEGEEAVGAMLPSMAGAEWPAVPVAAPVNVDVPYVQGTGAVGEELKCTWGNWNHEPTNYSGQWLRDNTVQVGTGETYTVQNADVGHSITCVVTAENALGFTTAPPSNLVVVTEGPAAAAASAQRAVPRQPPASTTRSEPAGPPAPPLPPKK